MRWSSSLPFIARILKTKRPAGAGLSQQTAERLLGVGLDLDVLGHHRHVRVGRLALLHLRDHRLHVFVQEVVLQHGVEVLLRNDVARGRRLAHLIVGLARLAYFRLGLGGEALLLLRAAHRDAARAAEPRDLDQLRRLRDLLRYACRQRSDLRLRAALLLARLRTGGEAGRTGVAFLTAALEIDDAKLRAG